MTDIAELFARDPLDLTKDDVNLICQDLRGRRKQFNLGAAGAGNMRKKQAKEKVVNELGKDVGLKDLGL